MRSASNKGSKGPVLNFSICLIGVFLLVFASAASGQQIHQLSYNNSYWADQNLNGVQSDGGAAAAFLTTPNDQSHVYYLSKHSDDGVADVHQLFYNGVSWSDEDLTILSGGQQAGFGSVTGFSVGNYQYVYYQDLYGDIHQLLYNNSNWVESDLTVLSGGLSPAPDSVILAFTTSPALHVYFTATDNDIHQLFSNDGKTWQNQDLTVLAGLQNSDGGYLQSGFNIGNLQYVHYVDLHDFHLHQLSYNNSKWSDTDLTALTKTQVPDNSVASFVIPGTKRIRIFFAASVTSSSSHVFQLASGNGTTWTVTDLTTKAKAPAPGGIESVVAYATTPNDGVHLFYVSNGHIDQLYQTGANTWGFADLTSLGNGALATDYTALAGFSLQNEQFVFYNAQ